MNLQREQETLREKWQAVIVPLIMDATAQAHFNKGSWEIPEADLKKVDDWLEKLLATATTDGRREGKSDHAKAVKRIIEAKLERDDNPTLLPGLKYALVILNDPTISEPVRTAEYKKGLE